MCAWAASLREYFFEISTLNLADKIASKFSPAYWDLKEEKTKTQYELFKKYDKFNFIEYKSLYNECKKLKINYMSTFFDLDSIDQQNSFQT